MDQIDFMTLHFKLLWGEYWILLEENAVNQILI